MSFAINMLTRCRDCAFLGRTLPGMGRRKRQPLDSVRLEVLDMGDGMDLHMHDGQHAESLYVKVAAGYDAERS